MQLSGYRPNKAAFRLEPGSHVAVDVNVASDKRFITVRGFRFSYRKVKDGLSSYCQVTVKFVYAIKLESSEAIKSAWGFWPRFKRIHTIKQVHGNDGKKEKRKREPEWRDFLRLCYQLLPRGTKCEINILQHTHTHTFVTQCDFSTGEKNIWINPSQAFIFTEWTKAWAACSCWGEFPPTHTHTSRLSGQTHAHVTFVRSDTHTRHLCQVRIIQCVGSFHEE